MRQALLVCVGIVIFLLPTTNVVLAKTLVAIVSDRSAADLASGADYFQRQYPEHQLVF